MREDHYTNDLASAGAYERMRAADEYDPNEDYEPDDPEPTPPPPRPTLRDTVAGSLAVSPLSGARYNVGDIDSRTVGFRINPGDEDHLDALATHFSYEGLQMRTVDYPNGVRFVFVRRGPKIPRPDPWATIPEGLRP